MKSRKFLLKQKLQNNLIKKLFFSLSPIISYSVFGKSMQPQFTEGQKILLKKKWFFCKIKKGDTVVLTDPRNGKLILKRIKEERNKRYFVLGDNPKESTDSRIFGWIEKKNIIGKVIF